MNLVMNTFFLSAVACGLTAASAIAGLFKVGPEYTRPETLLPDEYKGQSLGVWKTGTPLDDVPKGAWWEIFNDEVLNDLERRAAMANLDLRAAFARVEQARATARISRSGWWPTVEFNPAWQRQRFSPNQEPSFGDATVNQFRMPLDLSYEVDLWGRVRRGFESSRAEAAASMALYYNVLLTLQAEVAQNYFALRAMDAEIATVANTVLLRHEQVNLVRSRFEGGIGNELDIARAETELATAETDAAALDRNRAELENALAVLVGENPATFELMPVVGDAPWNPLPPPVPAGLPADLLERRPDVAEAERQLAAANARIGVAKAAFFPVLRLTGSGGYLSAEIEDLFNWQSRVWSIGPSLSLPIFTGGRNRANYRRSLAAYQESVARYRQQILVAFSDIENSLAAIHHLGRQASAQDRALKNARQAASLATERYRSGLVSYLEVVDANRAALITQRSSAQLTGQRLIASVRLIKALGGGWTDDALARLDP